MTEPRTARQVHTADDIPAGRWCWGVHRNPHVSDHAAERPDIAADVVLCDACYRDWQRQRTTR